MKYDVIIIGSGLGGLECGTILSREGYNVCVLEKNRLFGGCLQTFVRHGYSLDTGLHYVGSLGEGQILNQSFRYFGIMDRLRLKKLDDNAFDRIWLNGKFYDYATGPERFAETLAVQFPHERDGLEDYVRKISAVGNLVSVENLKKGFVSSQDGLKYMYVAASDAIASSVSDPVLRNVLGGNCLLYGGERGRSSFYEHGMIMSSYLEGAWRCVDGGMQIADLLVSCIRACGGTVMNCRKVTRIAVEDGHVTGVETVSPDGTSEFLEASNVISDIHPLNTLAILDRNSRVKPAYRMRIETLDNTYGVFTLYLMMEPRTSTYLNYNIYFHRGDDVWYSRSAPRGVFNSCLLSMQPVSSDSEYTSVISVMAPMYMDELLQWEKTGPEARGDSYLEFKARRSAELMQFLGECGADIEGRIARTLATTPLSYRDFTGTCEGSAYGLVKDCSNPLLSMVSPRTRLGNLFFTGQNVNVHGVMGVTLSSIMTCSEFLGQEYLTKRIAYA